MRCFVKGNRHCCITATPGRGGTLCVPLRMTVPLPKVLRPKTPLPVHACTSRTPLHLDCSAWGILASSSSTHLRYAICLVGMCGQLGGQVLRRL